MSQPTHLVRIEGVNIYDTVYDTQNISVVRGGGLALLQAPDVFEGYLRALPGVTHVEKVMTGASEGVFKVTAEHAEALEALKDFSGADLLTGAGADKPPFDDLCLIAASEPYEATDEAGGLQRLGAKVRAAQMRRWTVPPEEPGPVAGVCALDRVRRTEAGADRSPSVRRRFDFGRSARQAFYRRELADSTFQAAFTDNLEDMTEDPPDAVPEILHEKIAVLYADGNKFGAVRAQMGGSLESERAFSDGLADLRSHSLLRGVLEDLTSEDVRSFSTVRKSEALRFETLLWGGDELCWVAPAWLGWRLLRRFFELSADWRIGGQPLTHAVGLVFCHRKTPIRQVRALAIELADEAKSAASDAPANAFDVEVMTSIDIPEGGLRAQRRRLYGKDAPSLALRVPDQDEGGFAALQAVIDNCVGDGLPRSKLYQLLRLARGRNGFVDPKSEEAVKPVLEALDRYLQGPGAHLPEAADRDAFLDRYRVLARDAGPAAGKTPPLYSMAVLASLWDYLDPMKRASAAQGAAGEAVR